MSSRALFPRRAIALASGASLSLVLGSVSLSIAGESSLLTQYAPSSLASGSDVADMAAGDVDGDGDVDVMLASGNANSIQLLLNDGSGASGGFQRRSLETGPAPTAIALADADSDGDLDLLVGLHSAMSCYRNDGHGVFALASSLPFATTDFSSVGAALRDVDGDGKVDALIALNHHPVGASWSGALFIAHGDGNLGFASLPVHVLALPAFAMTVGDFDRDGDLDVAELGGYISGTAVNVALGNGDGTFTNDAVNYAAGAYAGALTSGDFDGDGAPELVAGGKYNLYVYANDGAGHFALLQNVGIGYYAKGATTGDLDGDGDLDLMATSGSSAAIRLMTNDGTGRFTVTSTLPATSQAYAVVLADTSGDGYPDPWASDVVTGTVSFASSHSVVTRYGEGKPNSQGCTPSVTASGIPSVTGAGFTVGAAKLLAQQPGLLAFGVAPTNQAALGGHLLVAMPWLVVPASTGVGAPLGCNGQIELLLPASALALAPSGTQVYMQAIAADPYVATGASLSDGLRFEILP